LRDHPAPRRTTKNETTSGWLQWEKQNANYAD